MSEACSARRYYLLQAATSAVLGDTVLKHIWRAKQIAQPGNPLPQTLPLVDRLADAGYLTYQDLLGADARELRRIAGLTMGEAEHFMAAFTADLELRVLKVDGVPVLINGQPVLVFDA